MVKAGLWSALLTPSLLLGLAVASDPPAPVEETARTGPPPAAVLFVGRWEFGQPVTFMIEDRQETATSGYYVAVLVDPTEFAPRGAPQPLIFANGIASIRRAGPLLAGERDWFVVVQIPEMDLTRTRFWLGPRLVESQLTPERVSRLWEAARAEVLAQGSLSWEKLSEASRRMSSEPVRTPADLSASALEFCDRARGARFEPIAFEPPAGR